MHVVVTDCHLRVTLSVIRELQGAGHTVTAVCPADRPPVGLRCRQAAFGHVCPPGLTPQAYVEWLVDVCQPLQKPVLFPGGAPTTEALARYGHRLRPYARFLVPGDETLARATDKPASARTARALGLSVPEQPKILEGETLDKFAARLPYPVVLKYGHGEQYGLSAARRLMIAKTPETFMRRYVTMSDIDPYPMVQAYVPGDMFCVSALMDAEHRPVFLFGHRRLRQRPITGGPSAACVSVFLPQLNVQAAALLRALAFTGWAMVAFRGTPDAPCLMKVTPRLWGGYPCALHAGARPARTYVRAVTEGLPALDPTSSPGYRTEQKMQYFPDDAASAWQYFRHGRWREAGGFVRDSFSPRVKGGVFSRRDLRGSWAGLRHGRGK